MTDQESPDVKDMPDLKWDDSRMETSYANVVNVSSSREEVSLFFGTNQTWKLGDDNKVTVELDHRIMLNPYAAKRMTLLLANIVKEYEKRYGEIKLDG